MTVHALRKLLAIDVFHDVDRTTLVMHGEADFSTADQIEDALAPLIADPRAAPLVMDLRELTFLDCGALRHLLDARERLVLIRGPRAVQRVFDLTGTAGLFAIVDSPAQLPPALRAA